MLLINQILGLRILLRVNISDGRHSLFLIAKMYAKLDRFFLENKEVQQNDQDLEWNLKAINASPPAGSFQTFVVIWHADGHEKERQTKDLHHDIGGSSKAFVK